jgi:hypothetical protein
MAELGAVAMQQVIKTQGRLKQPVYQYALENNILSSEVRFVRKIGVLVQLGIRPKVIQKM